MSDYTKTVDFAIKDSLPTGNANKVVKGTEIDTEFNNIATAIATKSNTASPTFTGTVTIPTADINAGAIDGTAIGASSASTGAFTTLTASGATTLNGNTTIGNASGDALTFHPAAWTLSNAVTVTGTWTDLGTVTTADINGGTLSGVTVDGDLTWSSAQTGVTLTSPTINGTIATTGLTIPAITLGGTVTSNGQSFSGTIADLGTVTTVDINGGTVGGVTLDGTISGTPTWASTQAVNISGTAPAGTLTGTTLAANVVSSSLTSLGTITSLVATTADINGGTGDNFVLGATTPAAATVTTLNTTGNVGIDITSPAYRLQVRRAGGGGSFGVSVDAIGATRVAQLYAVSDTTTDGTGHAFYTRTGSATDNFTALLTGQGFMVGTTTYQGASGVSLGADGSLFASKGSSGATANVSADEGIFENSSSAGVSILSPDANFSSLYFGSPSAAFGTGVDWSYDSGVARLFTFKAGASVQISADQLVPNLTLSGGSGSERAEFAGNVGIGTSPSAWSTSGTWFRALDLQNGGALASFQDDPSTQLITNAYFDGGSWRYKSTNSAGRYYNSGNTHAWDIAGSGTAGNAVSFSEAMRIDSSGHAIIPAGVTLGTSAGVYNAANTLDDYEEGTWTPSVTGETNGAAMGLSGATGSYVKVGRMVTVNGFVNITSAGSASGTLQFSNLPFTVANTVGSTSIEASGSISFFDSLSTSVNSLTINALESTTHLRLFGQTLATQTSNQGITVAQVGSSNSNFRFSCTYFTA